MVGIMEIKYLKLHIRRHAVVLVVLVLDVLVDVHVRLLVLLLFYQRTHGLLGLGLMLGVYILALLALAVLGAGSA